MTTLSLTTKPERGAKVSILDKGWIELQDYMGSDQDIVSAARTSFLGESKGEEADKKLLFYLVKNSHFSPLEMCEVKIRCYAPLVTYWQWVRHRMFNVNSQSGRYSEFNEGAFYVPDKWRLQAKSNKQASDGELDPDQSAELTQSLIDHYARSYALYDDALRMGVAREMARFFLPGFSVYYLWVIKCDVRNWLHFCNLRMANEAQYEIRVYAQAVWDHFLKPLFPWTCESAELYQLVNKNQESK